MEEVFPNIYLLEYLQKAYNVGTLNNILLRKLFDDSYSSLSLCGSYSRIIPLVTFNFSKLQNYLHLQFFNMKKLTNQSPLQKGKGVMAEYRPLLLTN